MVPAEISVTADRGALTVHWDDNSSHTFSAKILRANSRSAQTTYKVVNGRPDLIHENITIQQVNAIGNYAINIVFSDGYTKGIFPWSLFRELSREAS